MTLKLLGTVPLFAGLSRRQLGKLLGKFFEREYLRGEIFFLGRGAGKDIVPLLSLAQDPFAVPATRQKN